MRCVCRVPTAAGACWFYSKGASDGTPRRHKGRRKRKRTRRSSSTSTSKQEEAAGAKEKLEPKLLQLRRLLDGSDRQMGRSDGFNLVTSHVSVSRVVAQKLSEVLLELSYANVVLSWLWYVVSHTLICVNRRASNYMMISFANILSNFF